MAQAKNLMKDILIDAIAGPYPDFWRKYAPTALSKDDTAATVLDQPPVRDSPKRPESLANIAEWLNSVYSASDNSSQKWSTLPASKPITAECPGSCIVLERADGSGWDDTLMIGFAVADSLLSYPLSLAQLYALARQVFFAQPLRFSLHGLLVHGDVIEMWVFDRSGMYCSEPLSMEADYTLLVSILSVYAKKTEEELGLKPFLQRDEAGLSAAVETQGQKCTLRLEEEPFVVREEFFGTNMMCHRARFPDEENWTHVVKFKWRDHYHAPEQDAFDIVRQKNVTGVISLVYDEQIEEIADLRSRLRHKRCKDLFLEAQTDDPNIKGLLRFAKEGKSYFTNRFLR